MNPIKIMVVTGTRPELIKVSVLLRLLKKNSKFELIFIHSGQHYDDKLFTIFLEELDLPIPNYNINVGSHPNSIQTGKMLIELYNIIQTDHPQVILAQGDTNTVFASALSAFKCGIPFAHLEAGIRSFDLRMPEEVNRMLTGVCSLLNFAPTTRAVNNLLQEGIHPKRIYLVGNTVVDAVINNLNIAKEKSTILKRLKIQINEKIILLTIHRPSNVDLKENLENIINPINELKDVRVIFPIHPRTKSKIQNFGLLDEIKKKGIIELIDPLGYLDFLVLMSSSYFFLTDSGGLQEEAVILKKPCLTLRENTERPESVEIGANILVGNDSKKIKYFSNKLLNEEKFYRTMIPNENPFGDGTTSLQIINIIQDSYLKGNLKIPYLDFDNIIPYTKLVAVDKKLAGKSVGEYELEQFCEILELFDKNGNIIFPKPHSILILDTHFKAQFFR